MKLIPKLNSFSGTPYPDVYGEFEVTRIHCNGDVFVIRVKDSWPQVEIFIEGAKDKIHTNQDSIWKILTELKI